MRDRDKLWAIENLEESGISEAAARYAGIRIGPEKFIIPYFDRQGEPIVDNEEYYYRARLRTSVKGRKYEQAAGTHPHLYFPRVRGLVWDPLPAEVWIVEGEKKALCLSLLGVPAVGIGGVTSLASAVELEELAGVRKVVIAFDSEVAIRTDIMRAETVAANTMLLRGAEVLLARIPHLKIENGKAVRANIKWQDIVDYHAAVVERKKDPTAPDPKKKFKNRGIDEYVMRYEDPRAALGKIPLTPYRFLTPPSSDPIMAVMNRKLTVVKQDGKAAVVAEIDNGYMLRGQLKSMEADYANLSVHVKKKLVRAYEYWVQHKDRTAPLVERFVPKLGAIEGEINPWRGLAVKPKRNDALVTELRKVLHALFFESDSYGISRGGLTSRVSTSRARERFFHGWMRYMLLTPHLGTPRVAIVLAGNKQRGKSLVSEFFSQFFYPENYLLVTPSSQASKRFSIHPNRVCTVHDEGDDLRSTHLAGRRKAETTGRHRVHEEKSKNAKLVENYECSIYTTNELSYFKETSDETRYVAFEVSDLFLDHEQKDHAISILTNPESRSALLWWYENGYEKEFGAWDPSVRVVTAATAAILVEVENTLVAAAMQIVASGCNLSALQLRDGTLLKETKDGQPVYWAQAFTNVEQLSPRILEAVRQIDPHYAAGRGKNGIVAQLEQRVPGLFQRRPPRKIRWAPLEIAEAALPKAPESTYKVDYGDGYPEVSPEIIEGELR